MSFAKTASLHCHKSVVCRRQQRHYDAYVTDSHIIKGYRCIVASPVTGEAVSSDTSMESLGVKVPDQRAGKALQVLRAAGLYLRLISSVTAAHQTCLYAFRLVKETGMAACRSKGPSGGPQKTKAGC